jgi:hypothetical protein
MNGSYKYVDQSNIILYNYKNSLTSLTDLAKTKYYEKKKLFFKENEMYSTFHPVIGIKIFGI